MDLLTKRIAIVTGAGAGIGRGIARAFARHGARVAIAEHNEETGREVAEELAALGGEGLFIPTDIMDLESVRAAVSTTVEHWGGVDILVNNAYPTLAHLPAPIEQIETQRLRDSMTAGFFAVTAAMQSVFPYMQAQNFGRIINICSLNGVNAHKHTADYNSAKEAVRSYTRTAAVEWAPHGITANIICPGAATTPFKVLSELMPEMAADIQKMSPMGYIGDPEEHIAPVAVFLASEMSTYMTGNTLFVDGGGHINGVPWSPPTE